jgi:hypothetical protein
LLRNYFRGWRISGMRKQVLKVKNNKKKKSGGSEE